MDTEVKDKIYLISLIVLPLILFVIYASIMDYADYFFLAEKIKFSVVTASIPFTLPFVCYLFSLLLISAIKDKLIKINNKLFIATVMIFLFGIVFGIFFNLYVRYELVSQGYFICKEGPSPKSNTYVISPKLCR
ncbi:putative membrane protein [Proteus hauseri ATCC 700826]|uniref:Membrane protein n=1 Tax=Proteus hauseri ATCC 700826 TaxID=1354271 RepID=A0AAJ3HW16_PROHU|nr:DUF1240 domain-containing protein [Proteus hauseri]OAT51064.1 putative membrane protein [Proteus hauseri ATCC 700826]